MRSGRAEASPLAVMDKPCLNGHVLQTHNNRTTSLSSGNEHIKVRTRCIVECMVTETCARIHTKAHAQTQNTKSFDNTHTSCLIHTFCCLHMV